jgi:ATP-dependent exoDNAse (exonuclease V) beta subunit
VLRIHKASAGSGKTFNLTREYITLLLGRTAPDGSRHLFGADNYGFLKPKAHSNILAITFTNKATQEMTNRIIKELSILANPVEGKESKHLDHLCKYYNATADEVARAAKRALADLLFNFSWFNVSTIDSFFQNVLHTFARELDLPNNFSLEIEDTYPVAIAIGEMLSTINLPAGSTNHENAVRIARLKSWLENYMTSLIEAGKNANLLSRSSKLNRELTGTISSLRNETFKTHNKAITGYLANQENITNFVGALNVSLDKMRKDLYEVTKTFLDAVDASGAFEVDKHLPSLLLKNYLKPWAGISSADGIALNGKSDFSYGMFDPKGKERTTLRGAVDDDTKRRKGMKKAEMIDAWLDNFDGNLQKILKLGVLYYQNERFYKMLRKQIYLLGLFSEACKHIDDYCRENEAFLLGDTNSLLRKVICEVETPFVYERIGYTINNFLIDEFQDTSEMQWANLRPLVMESLARNNANLIIGDEKQCIYRFRNSNPELLGSEVERYTLQRFDNNPGMIEIKGVDISENTNWRSSFEVVTFNNSLFAYLSHLADAEKSSDKAKKTYAALIQQVTADNVQMHGYVKLLFGPIPPAKKKGDKDEAVAEIEAAAENPEAPAAPQRWTDDDQLRHLGEEIDRQLSSGYKPKDIAILVRTHQEGQMVIGHLLKIMQEESWTHGHIDIISSDAMEISVSPSVQLIIGILRLTTTPQYITDTDKPLVDGLPQMKPNPEYLRNRLIHRYELCVFDEVDLLDEAGNPVLDEDGQPQKRRVTAEEALMRAIKATAPRPGEDNPDELQIKLDKETAKAGEMDCPSLFAITERIIRDYIPEKSRVEECSFISAFQDLVLDFEEGGESDVETFLDWWDSRGRHATLPAPEGQNAINVMTIHQSKGLEFKCVHLPFFDSPLIKYKGVGWYQLAPQYFPGVKPELVPPFIPLAHSKSLSIYDALASQVQEFELLQLIDGLNVAYVAFTRAVNELIVYSDPVQGNKGVNFGTYLWDAVHNFDADKLDSYDFDELQRKWVLPLTPYYSELPNGESVLVYGAPTQAEAEKPKEDEAKADAEEAEFAMPTAEATLLATDGLNLPESFNADIPYEQVLQNYRIERPANMVLPEDLEQQGVFDITNERHVGNFLHDALSHVRHLADLPLAVERAAYRRDLERRQWEPYLNMLTKALSAPNIKPWFEEYDDLMTERPLTAADGLRRPDRVVQMPNGEIVVIDYKFGKPKVSYRDQVRNYMGLLSQCGYSNLTGYLFFPITSTLVPVS